CELLRRIERVRVVAGRARHLRGAAAELEVAAFAGVRRAAAGVLVAIAALPRPRVAREQHGVALRAGLVDPLRARSVLALRRRHLDEAALQREAGLLRGVLRMGGGAVVAGLAADAELDELLAVEVLLAR